AKELVILCDAEVGVMIFSSTNSMISPVPDGESTHQEDYRGKHHLVATNEMKFCLDASPKQKLISKEFKRGTFSACRWDANQMVLVLVGFALGLQKEEESEGLLARIGLSQDSLKLLKREKIYLAELSLLDYNCVKFLPSLVAASVVFLARFMPSPKTHPWNAALYQLTRYKPAELQECAQSIHDLYLSRRGGSLQAVREKYKQHKVFVSFHSKNIKSR
ncbi:hypothetical protein S245_059547, partial [Arachis hypogaea]